MADTNPSVDLDRNTGETITGWDHVLQSIDDFFTLRFGELITVEWYGSIVPALLGQSMNRDTIVVYFQAIAAAITQWEPRFRITKILPLSVDRLGRFRFQLDGQYRPRALLGDFTVEGAKSAIVGGTIDRTLTEGS